ncbi:YlaI family protein [Aquibacillus koreensis]|uniref:YlaI family protein n=1 Tax=Aquibacillus koreensis TaxID=279446 RepID=A0A9X4AI54_9BACI|nr:YlaI family protein [Aquibacillus koreensis]MCT2538103.1 YlaI family protein [Aquibacillus koreensis]MDC3420626.1 YlaI family protein [Aquibacillus koreensis]
MRVKCAICDIVDNIDSNSPQAKRLRNRRIHVYLCTTCDERIGEKTKQRHETGNFKLYKEKQKEDHLI